MTVLRYYKLDECDERGVPYDWERCRTCDGEGEHPNSMYHPEDALDGPYVQCRTCDGYGSLKIAAMSYQTVFCGATDETPAGLATCNRRVHDDRWHADTRDGELWAGWGGGQSHPFSNPPARCEDCGHPMSEGTWEDVGARGGATAGDQAIRLGIVLRRLREGREPTAGCPEGDVSAVHYSPCDEGCRHGRPWRYRTDRGEWHEKYPGDDFGPADLVTNAPDSTPEASWRPVDVRPLDRPCMLEPQYLAVLCLRCYAKRGAVVCA